MNDTWILTIDGKELARRTNPNEGAWVGDVGYPANNENWWPVVDTNEVPDGCQEKSYVQVVDILNKRWLGTHEWNTPEEIEAIAQATLQQERTAWLMANPDVLQKFGAFFAFIGELMKDGVQLPEVLTFKSIRDAVFACPNYSDADKGMKGMDLMNTWNDVLYEYNGAMRDAYRDLPFVRKIILGN